MEYKIFVIGFCLYYIEYNSLPNYERRLCIPIFAVVRFYSNRPILFGFT